MVAKLDGPQFSGGANIAIKCPAHTYDQTVAFYRDTLGLPVIEEEADGCIFQFGPNRLWIDKDSIFVKCRITILSGAGTGTGYR